jgi:hypothetical protein
VLGRFVTKFGAVDGEARDDAGTFFHAECFRGPKGGLVESTARAALPESQGAMVVRIGAALGIFVLFPGCVSERAGSSVNDRLLSHKASFHIG